MNAFSLKTLLWITNQMQMVTQSNRRAKKRSRMSWLINVSGQIT